MDLINPVLSAIKNIRMQDILDIAIIAFMIFAFFTWFKTRASRFVLLGIILLGAVYIAARFLQLYLTTIVLQSFFAIVLFVLVVIFQEDLRSFFERLALLGNLRKKARPLSDLEKTSEIITHAAVELAKKNIGALIVLQGDTHLDRHLNGGTKLDGLASEALLESIFDPHSDGHDGAVVIKGDRVTMFGCHLPLSTNTAKYGNIGLRHTAALGLAERSDAMCVVVSEETGTISLAYQGLLTRINNAAALHKELERFYMRNAPRKKSHPAVAWFKENSREKIIALVLACILWFAFGYQREIVRRNFIVPIEYRNVPSSWRIEEPRLTEAKVILQGPQQAFYLLDERSLKLSLDLSSVSATKQEFILSKDMVNAPSNLSVTEIKPAKTYIYASRLIAGSFPVQVTTQNALPKNLSLQRITISPYKIRVLYDSRLNPDNIRLQTEPIDLQKITATATLDAKVALPAGVYLPDGKPPALRVIIRVKEK
ncbi:MAG TPA: diadenylate cyclase [Smithellaceae bacterium]|nr:diadenylate cyclase [Smithellaceae bacterium]HRS88177.1 diadenylate cyclase [Smithellaceae bacterium]HRV25715.1 diadenylate cyclase [Smithellaceae bacterium]